MKQWLLLQKVLTPDLSSKQRGHFHFLQAQLLKLCFRIFQGNLFVVTHHISGKPPLAFGLDVPSEELFSKTLQQIQSFNKEKNIFDNFSKIYSIFTFFDNYEEFIIQRQILLQRLDFFLSIK